MVPKLQAVKVGNQKKIKTFWVRGYVSRLFLSKSLLSEQPGFDSRPAQTLRACNFEILGLKGPKITFFERSDLFLLVQIEKSRFWVLLGVFLVCQIHLKTLHKMQIDRERLKPAVDLNPFSKCAKFQDAGGILRVAFAWPNWPHLHRGY